MTSVTAPSESPTLAEAEAAPPPVPATADAPPRRRAPRLMIAGIAVVILAGAALATTRLVTGQRTEANARASFKQVYQPFAGRFKADTAKLGADIAAADGGLQRGDFLELSSAFSDLHSRLGAIDFGSHGADADQLQADTARLASDWHRAADTPAAAASPQVQRDGEAWDTDAARVAQDLGMALDQQGNLTG